MSHVRSNNQRLPVHQEALSTNAENVCAGVKKASIRRLLHPIDAHFLINVVSTQGSI